MSVSVTDTERMIEQVVAAAEKGYPNDRNAQVRAVAAVSAKAPFGMLGVLLKASLVLAEKALADE